MHSPLALHSHIERGSYRAYKADFGLHNIGFREKNKGQEQEHWIFELVGYDRWVKPDSICSDVMLNICLCLKMQYQDDCEKNWIIYVMDCDIYIYIYVER